MTDSNLTEITFIEETTWGTTPGSPSMTELRLTGESLIKSIENTVSEEIRSDRQVTDLIQVLKQASGDINWELSYATFDEFFKSALYSADWSTTVAISATDISASNTNSRFDSTSTDFTAQNISVGQWIEVRGFTGDTANNTFYRVTAIATNELTVTPAPASDDAAGETVTMSGSQIRNGVTETSFTLEKGFTGVSEFFLYTGMIATQMSMNIEAGRPITGGFTFIGKDGTLSGTSIDATPTAANSNTIMNAIGNVGSIREGDVEVAAPNFVRSVSIDINNNGREQSAVGSDSLIGVGTGKFDLTGTMNTYFGDSTLMDKFIAGTATSVDFRVTDASGNTYIFDIPQVKFESGNVVAAGQDQDVFAEMNYRAIEDPTYGFTFQINRFAA